MESELRSRTPSYFDSSQIFMALRTKNGNRKNNSGRIAALVGWDARLNSSRNQNAQVSRYLTAACCFDECCIVSVQALSKYLVIISGTVQVRVSCVRSTRSVLARMLNGFCSGTIVLEEYILFVSTFGIELIRNCSRSSTACWLSCFTCRCCSIFVDG